MHFVCVCVCVHAYIYIINVRTYVHMYVHMYKHILFLCTQAVEEEDKMSAEQLAIKNVGKQVMLQLYSCYDGRTQAMFTRK